MTLTPDQLEKIRIYLKEGNSKDDLIDWIIEVLNKDELNQILEDIKEQEQEEGN